MLKAYIRVLEAHEWKRVLVDSHIRCYAHPLHPHDRIQVFDGWWFPSSFRRDKLADARPRPR